MLIRNPMRMIDSPVSEILRQRQIQVSFDELGGDEISVPTSGYHLASDVPRSESTRWHATLSDLRHRVDIFVRKPKRVLARTVTDTRRQAQGYLDEEYALNEFERQELREELVKRSQRLTKPATPDILDRARLQHTMETHDKAIRRMMAERMRLNTILLAGTVVLLAWLGSFTPYLIQAGFVDFAALGESVVVVLVVCGLVVLAGLLTLMYMRYRLVRLVREFNSDLRSFVLGVNASAAEFGSYLSDLATYMYGHSVLMAASRRDATERLLRLRRSAIRKRIVEKMDSEKAIVQSIGHPLQIERTQHNLIDYDLDGAESLAAIFRLPTSQRPCALNMTGETIRAPYEFVSRLRIEHLSVRERTVTLISEAIPSDTTENQEGDGE